MSRAVVRWSVTVAYRAGPLAGSQLSTVDAASEEQACKAVKAAFLAANPHATARRVTARRLYGYTDFPQPVPLKGMQK